METSILPVIFSVDNAAFRSRRLPSWQGLESHRVTVKHSHAGLKLGPGQAASSPERLRLPFISGHLSCSH